MMQAGMDLDYIKPIQLILIFPKEYSDLVFANSLEFSLMICLKYKIK